MEETTRVNFDINWIFKTSFPAPVLGMKSIKICSCVQSANSLFFEEQSLRALRGWPLKTKRNLINFVIFKTQCIAFLKGNQEDVSSTLLVGYGSIVFGLFKRIVSVTNERPNFRAVRLELFDEHKKPIVFGCSDT